MAADRSERVRRFDYSTGHKEVVRRYIGEDVGAAQAYWFNASWHASVYQAATVVLPLLNLMAPGWFHIEGKREGS